MAEKRSRERTMVSACWTGVRCVNYPSLMFEHEGLVQTEARLVVRPKRAFMMMKATWSPVKAVAY